MPVHQEYLSRASAVDAHRPVITAEDEQRARRVVLALAARHAPGDAAAAAGDVLAALGLHQVGLQHPA